MTKYRRTRYCNCRVRESGNSFFYTVLEPATTSTGMDFHNAKVAGVARVSNERSRQPPGGDRGGAASYLASMIGDLAAISRRHDFEALTYILDMARLEAEATVQRLEP